MVSIRWRRKETEQATPLGSNMVGTQFTLTMDYVALRHWRLLKTC